MRRDLMPSRRVLFMALLVALTGLAWLRVSLLAPDDGVVPGPRPARGPATATADAAIMPLPSRAQVVLDPAVQVFWRQRRQQLDRLSRAYRAEPDSDRAAALKRDLQDLIDRSLREVYELRLAHARRDGHHALARRLERALADLPPSTTPADPPRPGG